MSTYGQLQSRIADELNRTDLTTQIQTEILSSIRHYRNKRMPFNETVATITASVGQAFLTLPTDFVMLDRLYITISSRAVPMEPTDLDDVIAYRRTSNARPFKFSIYQNQIELDAPCNSAYVFPIYYVKELATLSATTDSNGWTTDGEELIIYRSKKMLFANIIRDADQAKIQDALEGQAYAKLLAERNAKLMTGHAIPCYL